MDAEAAKTWMAEQLDVSRETFELLEEFVASILVENKSQNLISASSESEIWSRHIADSAQLVRFAPPHAERWLDLGTGPGFPGLVLAMLRGGDFTLVESRRLRAEFLEHMMDKFRLAPRVRICARKLEHLPDDSFDVITARAFAPLDRLLALSHRFSTDKTVWILPKGRNAEAEVEAVRSSWQGSFWIEPSVTDPEAGIVVAEGVRPAGKGRRR